MIAHLLWWALHVMGVDDASGPWYLFWSGIFADVTVFGTVSLWFWHHNCHVSWCLRIGHPVDGRIVCRRHHRH